MKKRFWRILAAVLAVATLLSLAACGGNGNNAGNGGNAGNTSNTGNTGDAGDAGDAGSVTYKDTLIWAQGSDVTSLDPHQGKETPAVQVTDQIFDTLIKVDPATRELVPQIAESWEQTDDLTYVFKIRQGIKFHDGSDLTAEDVEFSLNRAINSASVAYIVDFIDTVTADDEYTVTVTLKYPYAPALRNLAVPYAGIVPKAVVEADEDNFILNPVGSGPYTFVEWSQGDHVTLKAFDDYYAGKPATENLIMKVIPETAQRAIALETGEVDLAYDLLPTDIPRIQEGENTTVYTVPSLSSYYISLNMNKEPFNIPEVREAITLAIDRQLIIDTLLVGSGTAADSIIAPAVFGYYSTGVPAADVETAKQLLADAGYADGFSCVLYVNDNQQRVEICQAVQSMLKEINIEVSIEVLEFGSFVTRTSNGEHDMAFFGWTTSSGDADYTYYSCLHSSQQGNPGNRCFMNDPEVDGLIESARSNSNDEERQAIYEELAILLDEYHCNIPIYFADLTVGASKKVEGFVMDANAFYDLSTVKVAE